MRTTGMRRSTKAAHLHLWRQRLKWHLLLAVREAEAALGGLRQAHSTVKGGAQARMAVCYHRGGYAGTWVQAQDSEPSACTVRRRAGLRMRGSGMAAGLQREEACARSLGRAGGQCRQPPGASA